MTARVVVLAVAGLVLGWGLSALALWWFQDQLVFPGASFGPDPRVDAVAQAGGWRVVTLDRPEGPPLTVWHRPGDGTRALLMLHGNGGHPVQFDAHARLAVGWDVVAPIYRGYAGTPGTPSEAGVVDDGLDAMAWIGEVLDIPPSRTVVHGHSLGGGVAAQVAARTQPGLLVLASSFDSLQEMVSRTFWMFPVRWSLRTTLDSVGALASYDGPILLLHARDDRTVPITAMRRLAHAYPRALVVETATGGHQPPVATSAEARAAWLEALARNVPAAP